MTLAIFNIELSRKKLHTDLVIRVPKLFFFACLFYLFFLCSCASDGAPENDTLCASKVHRTVNCVVWAEMIEGRQNRGAENSVHRDTQHPAIRSAI